MRAGYEIPRPAVQSVGNQTATEVAGEYVMEQVGNYFGLPIFAARWHLEYALPAAPGNISGPPNLQA